MGDRAVLTRSTWALAVVLLVSACGSPPVVEPDTTEPSLPVTSTTVPPTKTTATPAVGWTVVVEAGSPWQPREGGPVTGGFFEPVSFTGGPDGAVLLATTDQPGSEAVGGWFTADGVDWTETDFASAVEGAVYFFPFPPGLATPDGFLITGVATDQTRTDDIYFTVASEDGTTWQRAPMAGLAELQHSLGFEQGATPVASATPFRDLWVAGGMSEGVATVWLSTDGRTWEQHPVTAGGSGVSAVAATQDMIMALGSGDEGLTVWGSTDGVTWEVLAGPDAFGLWPSSQGTPDSYSSGDVLGAAAFSDGVVALLGRQPRAGDAWCYADPETCGDRGGSLDLAYSNNGVDWVGLPTPTPGLTARASLVALGDTLLLAEAGDGQLRVWAAGDPGQSFAFPAPTHPELPFEIWHESTELEVGATYGYPMNLSCGIEQLGILDGQLWRIADPEDAPSPETLYNRYEFLVYGTFQVVAEDRIDYTDRDGLLIARYTPAPLSEYEECHG